MKKIMHLLEVHLPALQLVCRAIPEQLEELWRLGDLFDRAVPMLQVLSARLADHLSG